MRLQFKKMQALGNDFIVVNVCDNDLILSEDLVRRLADRHLGIGCDQLLVLAPASVPKADFDYWIFNADGKRAYQCGNGARCIARYVFEHHKQALSRVSLYTGRDILYVSDRSEQRYELEMPVPHKIQPKLKCDVLDTEVEGTYVDIGNPHYVLFVEDIHAKQLSELAKNIQKHTLFPHGVNVGFAKLLNKDEIELKVFERGVGATLACGTGAVASVIAARKAYDVSNSVNVQQPGGRLEIRWQGDGEAIFLTGPAWHIFDGEIDL